MSVKIEKKEGRDRRIYDVMTVQDFQERFALLDLIKQAAFNQGYVNVSPKGIGQVVGITKETLIEGTHSQVEAELYVPIDVGVDLFIYNAVTKTIYSITPTTSYNVGLHTIVFETTKIKAPSGSIIVKQSAQAAEEDRVFRERIDELNSNLDDLNDIFLPELDNKIEILEGFLEDPTTIPDNWVFFEGIVSNDIWAETGVFMQAWFDQAFGNSLMVDRVTSNHIDVDDLGANSAFITNLTTQSLTLASSGGPSPYIGGLIKANFDGDISSSNLIDTIGTTGWAIDWGGTAVFNDARVRGTIVVDGSGSNVYVKDEVPIIIRQDSAPSTRPDGSALEPGDIWIETDQGDRPFTWNGSTWIQAYTIIDGGHISTGIVSANRLDITGIVSEVNDDFNVTIRSTTAPTQRVNGESLVAGDVWIETDDGDKPYTWNGSSWIRSYTIIDGGDLITGSVTANEIDVDNLFAQDITWTGRLQNTIGGADIYIGNDLGGLKQSNPQILVGGGGGSGDIPFVHVRQDSNNYVEMVGRTGTETPPDDQFLRVVSGGDIVFFVNENGASYGGGNSVFEDVVVNGTLTIGSGGEIINNDEDYRIDENGIVLGRGSASGTNSATFEMSGIEVASIFYEGGAPLSGLTLFCDDDLDLVADGSAFNADGFVNIHAALVCKGNIIADNLPTSASGLLSGSLWNDNGTVKIA